MCPHLRGWVAEGSVGRSIESGDAMYCMFLRVRARVFCRSDFCVELIEKSNRELHDMFTRTYGMIYQQNSQVFHELFGDLRRQV